jgi:hypothetical protein
MHSQMALAADFKARTASGVESRRGFERAGLCSGVAGR